MPYPYDAKDEADKILEEYENICKELNIVCFLLFGTCLGLFRDKNYIKGDNDIDVGAVCSKNDFEKLADRLVKNGFIQESKGSQHFYKYDILLDIWRVSPKKPLLLETITYNGRTYKVPSPIEEYLEKTYYGDWKTKRYVKGSDKVFKSMFREKETLSA